jgi:hypothetical protein
MPDQEENNELAECERPYEPIRLNRCPGAVVVQVIVQVDKEGIFSETRIQEIVKGVKSMLSEQKD